RRLAARLLGLLACSVDFPSLISECGFGGIRKSAPIRRFVFSTLSRVSAMTIFRFTGQILPRTYTITMENHPTLKVWDYKSKADTGTMDISIENNEITVLVDLTEPIDENSEPEALRNANDAVENIVGLLSFANGMGLSFVIDKLYYEDGQTFEFGIDEPNLAKLATALQSET